MEVSVKMVGIEDGRRKKVLKEDGGSESFGVKV